jgi:3-methyladenine DNA glycosylase AlkD
VTRDEVLAWLERTGNRRQVEGLARYGIVAERAFGVPVGTLLRFAKTHGRDHALSLSLWKTGVYEARLLAAMLGDPARVTAAQMDAWAAEFDSWAVCDTVCWHLFDYTPFAFAKARKWARSPREFERRAAFATLAGQAGHNRAATEAEFLAVLPLVERGARDERNFVKKAVSWALRRIGGRSPALHEASVRLARRLAASDAASARWVGKDALRDLERPLVRARAAKAGKSRASQKAGKPAGGAKRAKAAKRSR